MFYSKWAFSSTNILSLKSVSVFYGSLPPPKKKGIHLHATSKIDLEV